MSWVATAVIGGAVVGGVASNSASKRAAEGQNNALNVSSAATNKAESEIKGLFGKADEQQALGFSNARDFLSNSIGQQFKPFQQGNMAAQDQVVRGLPQIQNAIMGNPVDLSGFQSRAIGQPSNFNLNLDRFEPQEAAKPAFDLAAFQESLKNIGIGGGNIGGEVSGSTYSKGGSFGGGGLRSYDTFNRQLVGK